MYPYLYVHMCMYVWISVYMYIYMYICIRICIYTYIHKYQYILLNAYIYTYTSMHTITHLFCMHPRVIFDRSVSVVANQFPNPRLRSSIPKLSKH